MTEIVVQRVVAADEAPADARLAAWAQAALSRGSGAGEMTLRLVDRDEMQQLNAQYRGRDRPTNVLSFPAEALPGIPDAPLGDVIICVPVVAQEAAAQGKALAAHWAHMVVHGCLHLLGYDHVEPDDAETMEGLEREILAGFGFPDPYQDLNDG